MKRRGGQAGRIFGEAFNQIGNLIFVLFSLVLFGVCLLGLRLSHGPLEVPHLASMLATTASGEGVRVEIQQAELAWAGYHQGGGVPLYLRLGEISVRNKEQRELIQIPNARLRVVPSALLGGHAPILVIGDNAQFAGSDVPVSLQAAIWLSAGLKLSHARVVVALGAGRLGAGQMSLPITGGSFTTKFTPHTVMIEAGALALVPSGKSAPRIGFSGNARLGDEWRGSFTLSADAVNAPDLAAYWPPALAPHTRLWVTQNIIAGTASNGVFNFGVAAPRDLDSFTLTGASGGFSGQGLKLIWLDGARPITALNGRMTILDCNDALVTADSARLGGLSLSAGNLKIAGLSVKDQTGYLSLRVNGTVQDVFAILNAPPVNLLAKAPPGLAAAKGDVVATVSATIPFIDKLPFAKIGLNVTANLNNVALASPVAGLNFAQGRGRVDATGQSVELAAHAMFAGEPANVTLEQSFTNGQQRISLTSLAGPVVLHELGLDGQTALTDPVKGSFPYTVTVSGDPDGIQNLVLSANLTPAGLSLPGFAWAKPPGQAGRIDARAGLEHGALGGSATLAATAPGLNIQAQLRGRRLIFPVVEIGGTRAIGTVNLPITGGWSASFNGPMLNMRLDSLSRSSSAPNDEPPSGPAWRLDLAFARLRLAPQPEPELKDFSLSGTGKGDTALELREAAEGVALTVKPIDPVHRKLSLHAADAGVFLKSIGEYDGMQGGTLDLEATYGGTEPFSGSADLQKFRILQAPAFAKILQALTVYGAAQAVSGPGLLFGHAVIPFNMEHHVLTLKNARAYSASLGFTASGTIVLGSEEANLDATIVPAYAFNSLPGKIPLLGHLFTAETGGGLIAIRARITGKLSNPKVVANPLSALTPGVLRGVFGLHKPKPK